jgi:hypothetical protein
MLTAFSPWVARQRNCAERFAVPGGCTCTIACPALPVSGVFRVRLRFRVEEAPGEGADVVEEMEGGGGSCIVDCVCSDEEAKVSVDLFC